MSAKRAAQNRRYLKLRAAWLEERPACEFPGGCIERATTIQHLRGRRGERLTDTALVEVVVLVAQRHLGGGQPDARLCVRVEGPRRRRRGRCRVIARYILWRELGFTRKQARALAEGDYVVLGWVTR